MCIGDIADLGTILLGLTFHEYIKIALKTQQNTMAILSISNLYMAVLQEGWVVFEGAELNLHNRKVVMYG